MSGALEFALIQDEAEFYALGPRWNRLVERARSSTVFQCHEWHAAWWRAVGAMDLHLALHVAVCRADGIECGIAPLMLDRSTGGAVLACLSSPYTDYHDFVMDRDYEAIATSLLEYALSQGGPWQCISLRDLAPHSPLVESLRGDEATRARLGVFVEPGSVCPTLDLNDEAAFRRAVAKDSVRYAERKLGAAARVECRHFSEPDEILARFDSFRAMHLKQWSSRDGAIGTFDDPAVTRFFRALTGSFAEKGFLLLSELMIDGRPAAYTWGFVFRRTYSLYRTCFEAEMARHSPGHILLGRLVAHLQSSGIAVCDFLRGAYPYKYRYANGQRQCWNLLRVG
jgi:CelD/BcsL family acetyltransferase involved in cellulose biosynthesis